MSPLKTLSRRLRELLRSNNFLNEIIIFGTLFFLPTWSFCEIIELNSGQRIEGDIVAKDVKSIKVDQGFSIPLTYFWDEIKTVSIGPKFKAKQTLLVARMADKLENRAIELIDQEKIEEGLSLMKQAIELDPAPMRRLNYASILFGNGVEYFNDGNRMEAMNILGQSKDEISQAIATFDPQKDKAFIAQSYFLLGEIALNGHGDELSAKNFYRKSLSYDDNQGAKSALAKLQ